MKPGLHRKLEFLLHKNFKHLGYMKFFGLHRKKARSDAPAYPIRIFGVGFLLKERAYLRDQHLRKTSEMASAMSSNLCLKKDQLYRVFHI